MLKNVTNLGSRENEFLLTFAGNGRNIFTIAEATKFWGHSHNTRVAIHRLVQKGWLQQIERGRYLIIPFEAGKERRWTEDSYIIASELVQPAAIAYWSAIRHWNWTEQIPRIVYVQTTKRKNTPRRQVFGVQYEFVTVNERKFFGHVTEWKGSRPILVTDREKTLVDCADDVDRAGSIEELAKAVKEAAHEISWQKLQQHITRFPNRAVSKRLGFLFETLVKKLPPGASKVLESWQRELSSGIALLQPSGERTGRIVTRWRILVNAEIG